MKIGIISDVHLFHKNSQIDVYKHILDVLQDEVDIIIDCGDLIDTNNLNSLQAEQLRNACKDIKIPMHIVRGNHDSLSNVSISSLLSMNNNIIVHNNIELYNDLLFVPYYSDITQLYKDLSKLNLAKSVHYAFSHLTITDNIYASIPFGKTKTLCTYADIWFNGHIHLPQHYKSLFDEIYNVGSFSSLTFGDEHIPCYMILNTLNDHIEKYTIDNSIIHKTIYLHTQNDDIDSKIEEITTEYNNMKINWRINLPNNFYVEERKKLKEKLLELSNTHNIQFNYLKTQQKDINKQRVSKEKIPLIQQLYNQYKIDTNCDLSNKLKNELEESI